MKPDLDALNEGFIVSVGGRRVSVHYDFDQAKAAALHCVDAIGKPVLRIVNYTGGADNRYGIEAPDTGPVVWDYQYESGCWVLRS